MDRLIRHVPAMASAAWILLAKLTGCGSVPARLLALFLAAAGLYSVRRLAARDQASPIHKAMGLFTAAASVAVWIWAAAAWPARYPAAALYAVLFLAAALPLTMGREVFTAYFARKTTPPAVWSTALFLAINRQLTALWSILFAAGSAAALIPGLLHIQGLWAEMFFEALVPAGLMLGIGLPANKLYPAYCQRKSGLTSVADPGAAKDLTARAVKDPLAQTDHPLRKENAMETKPTIVAVNGSPHAGVGNTALMIEMLRGPLAAEGFALEIIYLNGQSIEYCTGCALCLEKGRCWISDDHAAIVARLLEAAGIILASPVYFYHVTAQMKTFIDRSLAYGHRPQGTWKPGLAVSVSAGQGETQVAEYLSTVMRSYGAFPVGRLTALAVSGGDFIGREAVEQRARDLAGDLARAIREKRRYPATEVDLRFYQFMSGLVKRYKGTIMQADYDHWEQSGFFDGFEAYIQQTASKPGYDPEVRKAWIQEMIAAHKSRRQGRSAPAPKPGGSAPPPSGSCRELIRSMPLGFDPGAAAGLSAVLQFTITGDEAFEAHLRIRDGQCFWHEGPAERPDIVIRSPAGVWLAISEGRLDGQSAFMSGRFTAQGDLGLLMKLKSLFPPVEKD